MTGQLELFDILSKSIQTYVSNLHTATIAKITSVGATTLSCKPVINRFVDGESIELPEFIEVPPLFLTGGASYTAHPISVGDYCLLIFTERCFDRWYAGQDFQLPAEFRMHDYSDGIAIVGVLPSASAISIPNVITQVGDTYQNGDYEHDGDNEQTGDFNLTGNQTISGTLGVTGITTLGQLIFSSVSTGGLPGISGTFQQDGGGTITVTNGVITGIS